VTINAPNNATLENIFGVAEFPIIEPNASTTNPFMVTFSDFINIVATPSGAFITFESDIEGVNRFVDCTLVPCTVETGGIQTVTQLLWSDGTLDTIQFESDISDVPEPSAVMLLATAAGLTMFVGRRRNGPFCRSREFPA